MCVCVSGVRFPFFRTISVVALLVLLNKDLFANTGKNLHNREYEMIDICSKKWIKIYEDKIPEILYVLG